MKLLLVPTVLALFLVAPLARAEEVKIAAVDQPPFSLHKGGKPAGRAVEITRELMKRSGVTPVEIVIPINRMASIASEDVAVITGVARIASREGQYQWIGKVFEDRACFAIVKGSTPVTSFDQAKKLKAVAVNEGGYTEATLKKAGFANIEPAGGNSPNAKKLAAKRVDAWYTTEAVALNSGKEIGKEGAFECTGDFEKLTYWLAASKKVSAESVRKMQEAYAAMEKEGLLKGIAQ